MAITPVPAVDAVPPFPTFSDRATGTYNSKAYAWAVHMGGVFVAQIVALAVSVYNNATEALSGASVAMDAAITATAAAGVAVGGANFKGLWLGMSGPLTTPASVKHSGRFWLLLTDLADVSLSEPTSANRDWTSMDAGATLTVPVSSGSVVMVVGVTYLITGPSVTLQIPPMLKGDFVGVELVTQLTNTQVIDFGSTKFRGADAGTRTLGFKGFSWKFVYEDATIGVF